MADEKKKPGSPPPSSPFGGDDWDSELAAWDAALPLGDKRPKTAPTGTAVPRAATPVPPPPAVPEAPPDAAAVQFEMAEMASTEMAVPKLLPDIFPPFASDEESESDPTSVEQTVDLSDAIVVEEGPAATPTAVNLAETSGLLIIPDVDALAAMTNAPPSAEITPPPAPPRPPVPPPQLPERPESSEAARLRNLTNDGLPELSGLFSAETILSMEAEEESASARVPGAPTNVFEAEPPAEEATPLDLPFPAALEVWAPQELARAFAGAQSTSSSAGDRHYWRDQLAFWTDELAAGKEEGLDGSALAARAVSAARAAEQAGQPDAAQRFFDEALERDPGCLPALRGQLRLREPGPLGETVRQRFEALARAAGDERAAYDTLLAESTGATETSEGSPPSPTGALSIADRALRAGNAAEAAEALAVAARSLGGAVGAALLAEAARLRELRGEPAAATTLRGEARGLHAGELGVAFGDLRRAVGLAPAEALPIVEAAAEALPASALRGAILRWAARLARAAGDPARTRALLASAARALDDGATGGPARTALPERDRIALGTEGGDEPLSPEGQVLATLRAAAWRRSAGRTGEALEALRTGLAQQPAAVPLALVAEAMGREVEDPRLRSEAWAIWAEGDAARRVYAHRQRADALADDPAGAVAALAAANAAGPLDPAFWELAWAQLRRQDRHEAAVAMDAGAAAWTAAGRAEVLVAALEERAGELRRAADPAEAVQSPALSPEDAADDPASLVARMLDAEAEPAAIADLLKAEAPAGVNHRALEAAGWMVRAGAGNEALTWLLERGRQRGDRPLPSAMAQLVRRLARLHGDPASRAQMLADLSQAETSEEQRAALELQRAEALEMAGARAAAAEIYRALLAGPFANDADLALRRALWSARDAASLTAIYRDEADAQRGAGRPAATAASLVEQACVQADLTRDPAAAQRTLVAARAEDPANAEARVALLAEAFRTGRFAEAIPLLEDAARRDFPAAGSALLSLTALLDEARAGGRETARLVGEALARHEGAAEPAPVSLLLRAQTAALAKNPTSAEVAESLEGMARALVTFPGGDPRTAATLLLRAAEVREDLREHERAESLMREAIERDPACLPALMRLRRALVNREQWASATEIAEAEARAAGAPEHRAQALLTAASIAEYKLDDRKRATALLRQILDTNPAHPEAFARIRTLLEAQADNTAVAELLTVRLRAASDPQQAAALRIERSALLAGPLGDRAAAKEELRGLINDQPQNVDGLGKLATLELEDGAYAVAAELLIRQARFDRDPERLRDIFLQIGRIYLRRLPDPKLATGAFERVLRLEGDNREALEALSELYTKQNDIRKALSVTEPIIDGESDPQKRMPFLLRLATLWEKSGDTRRASAALKRAAEECPRNLQAVGELARFYERTKEMVARHVLLDGSIGILRADLRKDPRDLDALRTIIPLLRWRQRPACSAAAAQILHTFSDDAAEKNEAAGWAAPPPNGRRLTALANPDLEELALPPQVPRGVRNVLRLLGPTLAHAARPNLKRWEVGRAERQPPGTGLRTIADALAVDLGVRNFEVYVSNLRPRALAVEPGDPPAVIVGADIATLGPSAIRFACGYALRLLGTNFDLLAQGNAADAGVLLAGIVRQFVPDFRHPELPESELAASSNRVARALPKSLRVELAPYAAEIASPLPLDGFMVAVQETAARVGLLASGDLGAALAVLCTASGQPVSPAGALAVPVAVAVIDFALSEEHEQLVAALDAQS